MTRTQQQFDRQTTRRSNDDATTTTRARDVQISTRAYQRAHGTLPRGRGSWAFCASDKYDRDDYLDFVFWADASALYSDACKQAREHFAVLNITDVVVCS